MIENQKRKGKKKREMKEENKRTEQIAFLCTIVCGAS
jgi:hypothetical protein